MALNIKNAAVERLAAEVADITGESKTEALRQALLERRHRLAFRTGGMNKHQRIRRFLEQDLWPSLPSEQRGRRLTTAEEDAILGYGQAGV
ncbi:MAG: type II toxin-antitoxin system VapB family antitoxin [Mycobacteriales bacterium]